MFPHQTLHTCLSPMICIPHEFVSTRYGMIQFHLETICCHFICLHETLDMYCNDMYLCFRTKHSRYVFVPHDMHPARVRFDTIRYDPIETICCRHVIFLDETLDVYCNDMYLCLRTKLSIRVCPASYASSTSSFRHDTV